MRLSGFIPVILIALFGAGTIDARPEPGQVCDVAAQTIAQETSVPLNVLRAITRTETGRNRAGTLQPWPWTVNMQGKGVWFDDEDQARAYVFHHFKKGARSFDVGCFQINYRWHGQHFNSIEEMFDPLINTRYAARFLRELYAELGDWTAAAGAYHSRTEKYADKYMARFARILRDLPQSRPAIVRATPTRQQRHNSYSLLTGSGSTPTRGSLVPLTSGARSLFAPRTGG
ncbi:lytic transglycosylase domain-containing protein [Sulfitobacter albidus]|uniref:Lytic transglycosylase domain-containing protein n=1 Tax=Sulfitobacter albidus TaxID=2829501 RepID=A0A975JDL4_9RHOB|nr:lytic transglycosylase domain-containing protein [Sulfitobacter albidus]QUJ76301.1 lytic transglycosylase domain-containing protein [Sulfitobacter albidus]